MSTWKKWLCAALSLLMVLAALPVTVLAEELADMDVPAVEDRVSEVTAEEKTEPSKMGVVEGGAGDEQEVLRFSEVDTVFIPDVTLPDSDTLLEEHLYRSNGISAENPAMESETARTYTVALGGDNAAVYDELSSAIRAIASGDRESTMISLPSYSFTFTKEQLEEIYGAELTLTFADENEPATPANQALAHALKTKIDHSLLVNVLLANLPYDLYWFNKDGGSGGGIQMSYGISYTASQATVSGIAFTFFVSADYGKPAGAASYRPDAVDTAKTNAATAAAAAAQTIVNTYNSYSDDQKLVAYFDKIKELVSYNSAALNPGTPYGDPWQVIYVFDGNVSTNVVCEGYSKAFKYLCDLTIWSGTVKCNVATGIMSGGTGAGAHMWNIVTIGNANYLADITNCDDGTIGYPDELFLCGVSGSRDAYAAHGVSYEYDSTTQTIFTEEERTLSSTPFDPASVKDVAKIRAFVERMYTKCLGRAAETSGTEFWIGELLNGKEGSTLALEFFSSEEYRNKNLTDEQFIETLYQTFFDRTGDIGGIAYWMGEMKTGADRSVVFAGFCNSEEFTLLCESSGIVRGTFIPAGQDMGHYVDIAKIRAFVERMYTKCLGRTADPTGTDFWTNELVKGAEGSAIAANFFTSEEYRNKHLPKAEFIETLYQTFFDRAGDAGGLEYWIGEMESGTDRSAVFAGFCNSEEFTLLCENSGIVRGTFVATGQDMG